MMGMQSRGNRKKAPDSMRAVSSKLAISPLFFWHLLAHFMSFRMELPVKEVMIFSNGDAYYVCPRCRITLEREFMAYCDRCGQCLGWKNTNRLMSSIPDTMEKHIFNSGHKDGAPTPSLCPSYSVFDAYESVTL